MRKKRNDSARYQLPSSVLNLLLVPSPLLIIFSRSFSQGDQKERERDEEITTRKSLSWFFVSFSLQPWCVKHAVSSLLWFWFNPFFLTYQEMILSCHFLLTRLSFLSIHRVSIHSQPKIPSHPNSLFFPSFQVHWAVSFSLSLELSFTLECTSSVSSLLFFTSSPLLLCSLLFFSVCSSKEYFTLSFTLSSSWANRHHHNENSGKEWKEERERKWWKSNRKRKKWMEEKQKKKEIDGREKGRCVLLE